MTGQRSDDQDEVERRQSVAVTEGEVFEVTVEDLPGAGYRWVVGELAAGLTLVADEPEVPPASSRVGDPARRAFRLRAERPGSYVVHLSLVRPWEPSDVPSVQSRTISVEVAAGPP